MIARVVGYLIPLGQVEIERGATILALECPPTRIHIRRLRTG